MKQTKGYFLAFVIVFSGVALLAISGLISFSGSNILAGRRAILSEQAFQIAEAGIEYYRWHLAHDQDDYTDGGGSFPHTHNFYNQQGTLIGTFELTVTPPPTGSTMVSIRSTGRPSANPSVRRTIESSLAIPSFARFAVVTDSPDIRFGEGTDVVGPIHSNGGIRFDGVAHNLVTSALSNYNDPDHSGSNEFAVHTHDSPADPLPPAAVPVRNDVFMAGRMFPVSPVNFSGITTSLSGLKALAQSGGRYHADAGGSSQGYRLVLRTNDSYDLYRVNSLQSVPNGCSDSGQTGWGSWSVNGTTFLGNYTNPANGIIFVEDHLWVEGQINSARLTIAAGVPSGSAVRSITVNNNLLYTNYDGQDALALIAEDNFNVGMASANILRIDAALISNNGRVGRYSYEDDCFPYDVRSTITLYGMIGSADRYGFAYTGGGGYQTRNLIYDAFLLYAPPPSFPLTGDQYNIVSWQEVLN